MGEKVGKLSTIQLKCDYCEKYLSGSLRAKNHYKNYHANQPMLLSDYIRFDCYDCSDFFFSEDELNRHCALKASILRTVWKFAIWSIVLGGIGQKLIFNFFIFYHQNPFIISLTDV